MSGFQEEKKETIHTQIYRAAQAGNFPLVKELHKKGGDINSVLMGATDGKRMPDGKRSKECVEIMSWALDNKACYLFGFTQPEKTYTLDKSNNSFFSRVSMLKGPGDVAKGSFKSSI